MNIKSPLTEQATVLNYFPSGYSLQKIYDECSKSLFAVIQKTNSTHWLISNIQVTGIYIIACLVETIY